MSRVRTATRWQSLEHQLSALGLVLNCVVVWNTVCESRATRCSTPAGRTRRLSVGRGAAGTRRLAGLG